MIVPSIHGGWCRNTPCILTEIITFIAIFRSRKDIYCTVVNSILLLAIWSDPRIYRLSADCSLMQVH